MDTNDSHKKSSRKDLKVFFIKLISISIAIIVVVNLMFNLIFAERLEKIDKILLLNKSNFRNEFKDKLREEISGSLEKENLIYEEDKILLYKLYQKLQKEFQDIEKSKL